MSAIDSREDQIIAVHSSLIAAVAHACEHPERRQDLEPLLQALHSSGAIPLARALRDVLSGRRDRSVLRDLDQDHRVIVERVLLGLHNPAMLPDPEPQADPAAAAPGLAAIIRAAAYGDGTALQLLDDMAMQMGLVGGDMARLGSILGRLVQGERNHARLCGGMGALGRSLVSSILDQLARCDQH